MNELKISLLLVSRNEERFAGKFFESLSKQTRKPDEVILVDSSTDKTPQIAKPFVDKIVRVKQQRCSFQRWTGMQHISGEAVAITDIDAILEPEWLEELEKRMLSNPGISVVTGAVFYPTIAPKIPPLENARVNHCNALYKRNVLEEFPFDPKLRRYESIDLQYRYKKKYRVFGAPNARVFHVGTLDKPLWEKAKEYGRGRIDLTKKHKTPYFLITSVSNFFYALFVDRKPKPAFYTLLGILNAAKEELFKKSPQKSVKILRGGAS